MNTLSTISMLRSLALGLLLAGSSVMAANFTVDTTLDSNDAGAGDGICADAGGNCSLRAAIEEANSLAGADTVTVPAGTYVLTLGQLAIEDALSVSGAGMAATIIDGNAASRIFAVGSDLGSVTIEDLTIQNGQAGSAGGVAVGGNTPTLMQRVALKNNFASQYSGGAIHMSADSELTVADAVISGNRMTNPGGSVALIYQGAHLTLRNSTVTNNGPSGYGVILDWADGSAPVTVDIENSTIAGNGGTALYANSGNVMTITNSTITNNGGGIRVGAGNNAASIVTVTNSILYGNEVNCAINSGTVASIVSGGHNIDSRDTCGFTASGDLVNTHPKLGALLDNGGPTPTRSLLAGSPALNAGDNSACLGTDQRGTLRNDGNCDIGAFEGSVAFATCLPGHLAVDSTTDAVDANIGDGICDDGSGACTLRAAIQEANACVGGDIIDIAAGTYPLTLAGLNENATATGDLDITDDLSINGAGAATTIIDGSAPFDDRIFHGLNGVSTTFDGLTLQGVVIGGMSGGGIATNGNLKVSNSVITGNTAGNGTGIYATGSGTTVTVTGTTLSDNNGNNSGAGIYVGNDVTLTVSGSTLSNNTQAYEYGHRGAAIYAGNGATVTVDQTLIDNNASGYAQSVYGHDNSTITIRSSTVSNSQAGTRGITGWIGSTINIVTSTISGNLAGGIETREAASVLNITDSTISNNEAHALGSFSAEGAGASIGGTFTITGSTFSGNRIINDGLGGSGSGAGIYIAGTGSIVNSTISGNHNGGQSGIGGGIGGPGTLTLLNSTLSGNTAPYGGNINLQNGALIVANSILDNGNCELTYMPVTSNGHNIDSGNTCGLIHATDLVNTDPQLDVLADNGGWTQTHALLSAETASPAIDAGDAAVCADASSVNGVDQRGFSRPNGSGCDIGAYEDMPLYQLEITLAGTGGGRVTSAPGTIDCQSGICVTRIGDNTPALLTAVPDADSVFDGWSGDCATTESGDGSVLMDAHKSCTASFSPIQHTLTVIVSPLGVGTVQSRSGGIDCGTDCEETLPGTDGVVELSVSGSALGWDFSGWSGCDQPDTPSTSRCTMRLDTDKVLTAQFLSASIAVDDGISPNDDRDMPFGEVLVGTSGEVTVIISNVGEAVLNDIWVQDTDLLAAPFSMQEDCSDMNLQPGESCSFTVSFAPTTAGTFSDSFDILSEDPDEQVLTITVTGRGFLEVKPVEEEPDGGFEIIGKGGGDTTGTVDLLLLFLFALLLVLRRKGAVLFLVAIILAPGLMPQMAEAGDSSWYLGAGFGPSRSSYSESQLRNHLEGKGYTLTSLSVDSSDNAWKLFAGYQFNRFLAIEGGWTDLGEVKSSMTGSAGPSPIAASTEAHGYMGKGYVLSAMALWPVTERFSPFLKLGVFRWGADVHITELDNGVTEHRSVSGRNMLSGIGLRYMASPEVEVRAEYEYFDLDPDAAGMFSMGVSYHF